MSAMRAVHVGLRGGARSARVLAAPASLRMISQSCAVARRKTRVNDLYRPGIEAKQWPVPGNGLEDTFDKEAVLGEHSADREWSPEELAAATQDNVLFTWGATNPMISGAIAVERAEGCYFWDTDGKRYLDFNSQAMCISHGYTVPQEVKDAVAHQLEHLPYGYPGVTALPIRAKLSKLLAQICPGDINSFMFPSSGAEANETAVRMARVMTGRHKVMTRYRSYHGGTVMTLAMSGDQRRWPAEAGASGHVHFFDPYAYSFSMGDTAEEVAYQSLTMLREQILYEGPHTVAAIVMESITGTNGILKPPPGYLEGIREMCDEFGIVMVCDEVMAGFGRTGKMFGFMHADVVPDIVTFAKGVNGAFVPLGGVGVRDHVADYFRTSPVGIGSTYNSHPVALASAHAALQVMIKDDLVGNAARLEPVMQECMDAMLEKHPSVKQARSVGLFGCLDIQKNTKGDFIAKVTDAPVPGMVAFRQALLDNGVWTLMRGHTIFTNPPLVITEEQVREGWAAIDKALDETDAAMED